MHCANSAQKPSQKQNTINVSVSESHVVEQKFYSNCKEICFLFSFLHPEQRYSYYFNLYVISPVWSSVLMTFSSMQRTKNIYRR